MRERPDRLGTEKAARQVAQAMARALPVTLVSIALLDRPSLLSVHGVGAARPLPDPLEGVRLPLSSARWHRTVFEGRAPVLVRPDGSRSIPATAMGVVRGPDLTSMCFLPLVVDDAVLGIVALGEMRSWDRAPLSADTQERGLTLVQDLVTGPAQAGWEVGRLHRKVDTLLALLPAMRRMLGVRSPTDVLACLTSCVADWLGVHVRGVLLAGVGGRMAVVACRALPGADGPGVAEQLVLAMGRAERDGYAPVSIVRVADDPLDPFNGDEEGCGGWTRLCVPLLRAERLVGLACLYVEDEVFLGAWERDLFSWLAETAAAGLERVGAG